MKRFMLGFIIVICLSASTQGYAAYHWVSSSGSAAWGVCFGDTDPGVYCSLATANANAAAGDTVYLKAGTYSDDGYINPAKSGSSGSPITYQAYGGTVTIFPHAIAQASTWNKELIYKVGTAISDESRSRLNHGYPRAGLTFWAPVVEMARDPRWGRTHESYGEDP